MTVDQSFPRREAMQIRNLFKRRAVVVAVATVGILLVGGGVAVAAATVKSGTGVTRTTVRTENAATTHTGTAWTTLASSSVFAPAGGFILSTFSAESACYGAVGWCSVRILIGGVEAEPAGGTDFSFDSTDANRESSSSWESHSMQRSRSVSVSTTYAVVVQVAQVGAGVVARYDDWTLTNMAITP